MSDQPYQQHNCKLGDRVLSYRGQPEPWIAAETGLLNDSNCPLNFRAVSPGGSLDHVFSPFAENVVILPPAEEIAAIPCPPGLLVARRAGLSWWGYRYVRQDTLEEVYICRSEILNSKLYIDWDEDGTLSFGEGKQLLNESGISFVTDSGEVHLGELEDQIRGAL